MARLGKRTQWLLTLLVVAAASMLWGGVPGLLAAGKALDHPAWTDPTNDPGSRVTAGATSWWPPGRRYVWTGARTGRVHTAIDPWSTAGQGHLWTAILLALTAGLLVAIWKSPRRSMHRPHARRQSS